MIDERKILEKLYTDVCNIFNLMNIENEYGITKQDWVLIKDEEPCGLSKKTLNDIGQTEGEAVAADSMVLFLDDRILVQKGSRIDCNGYVFYAGHPFVYIGSHQEIPLSTKEYA